MKLAWHNIAHDRVRFAATVLGIAFAVFLMIFQGSLLFGFLRAASKIVDSTDADLWISARGVTCFDFPASLSRRFIEVSRGVSGIIGAGRIITSFAEYRKPDGKHQLVALVGADPEVGRRFPVPRVNGSITALEPDGLLVDESNTALLDLRELPSDVEINGRRARVTGTVAGFSSFLGSPYIFTSYTEATRYLRLGPEEAMYILLRLEPGYTAEQVRSQLRRRLPEVDIWTRAEFSRRSRLYWITQTGAGGGILIAAILGFLIGLVIVSQNIYATTMENLEEFATLKALGASRWFIIRIVLMQALACGMAGSLLGVAATFPLVEAARNTIAWIYTPWWLPLVTIPPGLLMCGLASIISVCAALLVEPARVFRA